MHYLAETLPAATAPNTLPVVCIRLTTAITCDVIFHCTFAGLCPCVVVAQTSYKVLARNGLFVVLSLLTAVGPSIGIAMFSYEFPSLIGEGLGCEQEVVLPAVEGGAGMCGWRLRLDIQD